MGLDTRPRLSHSKVERYLRCGESFRRRWIDGERRQTTKMLVGSAVGRAAEADNKAKISDHRALTVFETLDIALEAFEGLQQDRPVSDEQNLTRAETETVNATRTLSLVASKQINSLLFAEEKWAAGVSLGGGREVLFTGIPDAVTSWGIGDYKTGKRWRADVAWRNRQVPFYALLHAANLGRRPDSGWIWNLFRIRGGYGFQQLEVDVSDEALQASLSILRAVEQGISGGIFLPAAGTEWSCSPQACEYFHDCPYTHGGTHGEDE